MEHVIDAKGKSLGRVASAAAVILLGKNSPSYRKDREAGNCVLIVNSGSVKLGSTKMLRKTYTRYSGYPGGLKNEKVSDLRAQKGMREVMRRAVRGMLPANKTRNNLMKKLKVEE